MTSYEKQKDKSFLSKRIATLHNEALQKVTPEGLRELLEVILTINVKNFYM